MVLNRLLNDKDSILLLWVRFMYNKTIIINTRTVNRANIADLVAKIAVIIYVVDNINIKLNFLLPLFII